MRDNLACLMCGASLPKDARVDRKYCDKSCNNRHWKKIRAGKAEPHTAYDPAEVVGRMSPQRLGWVAGIVEGEGSFLLNRSRRHSGNVYTYSIVSVTMADEDVVRRLREWTGIGRVSGPHNPPSRAGHKPQWAWHVTKARDVDALVDALYPLLGERRQQQADRMRQGMAERTLLRAI